MSKERYLMIDGLRGIAASSVMFYHIYGCFQQFAPTDFVSKVPWAVDTVLGYGYLGVQVFFVISGFVMAHSLRRYPLDLRNFGVFALRRSVRLDPPYWLAIWMLLAIDILGNMLFEGRQVILPTPLGVVANMFYLDNILGTNSVVTVGWTLCFEFQFYLVFFLLLWMARQRPTDLGFTPDGSKSFSRTKALWIFVPATAFAYCWPLGIFQGNIYQGLWFPQWFMFLLGVFSYWALTSRVAERWFLLFLALNAMIAVRDTMWMPTEPREFVGLIGVGSPAPVLWATFGTAALIYVAGKLGRLSTWLDGPVMQHLGRISYSLYLMHVITGSRLLRVLDRFGFDTPSGSILLAMIGILGSLGGAYLMYYLVERPCVRFGERLKARLVTQGPSQT